ncbi:MAG: ribose transport system permease protein [Alpinimonas sp.]|jgi:ribose transport system permease protein
MTTTISETGSVVSAETSATGNRFSAGKFWQVGGPGVIFILMFAVVAILTPAFIGSGGITIVASSAAPILLVALGQAFVLNIGSIDLSNASITVLGAILLAMLLGPLAVTAPLVVLAMVTLFGALNGFLLAYTQVPSFALTLGTLGIFKAASLVVSGATTVYVSQNKEVVSPLYTTQLGGLPLTFILGVVVAVLAFLFLRYTRAGMGMTAIGVNESGAIFSAVRTRALKITAFALSGFMAGLAGMTIIAQAGSASATGLGSDLLLPAIAAAIVGGTSISGGVTNPLNVILGALTIALVPIATAAIGVAAEAQNLVYGVVIIIVVSLTLTRSRTAIVK